MSEPGKESIYYGDMVASTLSSEANSHIIPVEDAESNVDIPGAIISQDIAKSLQPSLAGATSFAASLGSDEDHPSRGRGAAAALPSDDAFSDPAAEIELSETIEQATQGPDPINNVGEPTTSSTNCGTFATENGSMTAIATAPLSQASDEFNRRLQLLNRRRDKREAWVESCRQNLKATIDKEIELRMNVGIRVSASQQEQCEALLEDIIYELPARYREFWDIGRDEAHYVRRQRLCGFPFRSEAVVLSELAGDCRLDIERVVGRVLGFNEGSDSEGRVSSVWFSSHQALRQLSKTAARVEGKMFKIMDDAIRRKTSQITSWSAKAHVADSCAQVKEEYRLQLADSVDRLEYRIKNARNYDNLNTILTIGSQELWEVHADLTRCDFQNYVKLAETKAAQFHQTRRGRVSQAKAMIQDHHKLYREQQRSLLFGSELKILTDFITYGKSNISKIDEILLHWSWWKD